ncbi:9162_t:CDS:2, partial [Gigaspora rosea]
IPYVESSNVEWYEQRLKEGRIFQYDYSKFINKKQIGEGGFGTVYSADYGDQKLALKRLNSKSTIKDFAREVKKIYKVSIHDNINRFHGITYEQRPTLKKISNCLEKISKETVYQFIINEKHSPASSPFSETSTGPSEYFTLVTIDPSNIITRKHAEMISSCIYGNNFPCKFKLLYRASRDGLKLKNFHSLCDDKEGTVVVSKVNQTEVLGGYNPIIWQKAPRKFGIPVNSSVETRESFIFSFNGTKNVFTCSRVINAKKAIYYSDEYGPSFGKYDLSLRNDMLLNYKWYCEQKNYSLPIRSAVGSFDVEDYEVFWIEKNQ